MFGSHFWRPGTGISYSIRPPLPSASYHPMWLPSAVNHTICFAYCNPLVIIIFLPTLPANFGTNPWRNGKWEIVNPHLWKFQTIFSNWSVSNNLVTKLHPIRLLGVATLQNWKIDDDGKNPDYLCLLIWLLALLSTKRWLHVSRSWLNRSRWNFFPPIFVLICPQIFFSPKNFFFAQITNNLVIFDV